MRTYRENLGFNAATWLFRAFFWLWLVPPAALLVVRAASLYRTDLGRLGLGVSGVAFFAWIVLIAPWLSLHAAVRYFDDGTTAVQAVLFALGQARLQLALLPVVGRFFAPRTSDAQSSVQPR